MVGPFVTDVCANPFYFEYAWNSWEALAFLALAAMSMLLGLLYMAAELFRVPQLQAWVKFELFQVFATAAIILFVAALVSWMCGLSADIVTGDPALKGKPIFAAATDYLYWVRDTAAKSWGILVVINRQIQRMANVTWVARPSGFGYATTPLGGMNVYSTGTSIMFTTIMLILLTTLAQINVLNYINIAFLTYLLPLGVLLRCLAPTRQFGGMLMGLSIGFFILFPLLLLMNDSMIRQSAGALLSQASTFVENVDSEDVPGYAESLRGSQGTIEFARSTVYLPMPTPPIPTVPTQPQPSPGAPVPGSSPSPTAAPSPASPGIQPSQPAPGASPAPIVQPSPPAGATPAPQPSPEEQERKARDKAGIEAYNPATTIAWYLRLALSLMMAGIVLPAVNFLVLITAIRELTRFLGDEIDVSSITRMI